MDKEKKISLSIIILICVIFSYFYKKKQERKQGFLSIEMIVPFTAEMLDLENKNQKIKRAKLIEKRFVSVDTIELTFVFSDESYNGFISVGKHLKVFVPNPNTTASTWSGRVDPEAGKSIIERKYTPILSNSRGFTLAIKVYSPSHSHMAGGKVSQYLDSLQVGNEINVELPFGIMEYFGNGKYKKSKQIYDVKHVGMIAGGSGITPMLRLLDASLHDKNDQTKYYLIFGNRSENDIILRDRLDDLANNFPNRFQVTYTLTRPLSKDWNGGIGLVSKNIIESSLPKPTEETLILLCGPPNMIHLCKEHLEQLKYSKNMVWDF